MKIVIQCAGSKDPAAGCLIDSAGKKVKFVAHPEKAPTSQDFVYARPDDLTPEGISWRKRLLEYNEEPENPLGLLEAYRLYAAPVYGLLADQYGLDDLYILSAGWGLIDAKFLTSDYDITFSNLAAEYQRRRKRDKYDDLCLLPLDGTDEIVFFGAKSYLPLFCRLTDSYRGPRYAFYNSGMVPSAPGCNLVRYPTTARTNWQYLCAEDFIAGKVSISR